MSPAREGAARGRGGRARAVRLLWTWIVTALPLLARAAHGQDFSLPQPAWPVGSASDLLERGLPAASGSASLDGGVTRWFGLASLDTRAAAVACGWSAVRAAVGLSQTGDPELGWTTLGVALGASEGAGGAAVRAAARRDRTTRFGFDARGAAVGLEVGGGAWCEAAAGVHLWASAPQIWSGGEAPPLARALEIGVAASFGDVDLWLARDAVIGAFEGGRGEHAAGVATTSGVLTVWLTARDQPLRGGIGVAARAAGIRAAAEVQGHPVLGETTRLSLGVGGGR